MKTIVTGGAGFLGSHLCDLLLEKGHEVICIDNLVTGNTRNIEHIKSDRFTYLKHDITKPIYFGDKIVFKELPLDDPKQRRPDIGKARQLLGWEPKVGLEEGLRETIGYFKDIIKIT
ncbi:MAG: GDP-mannose 4,6-dehydratase [Candidatus Methanoperedens sp.]